MASYDSFVEEWVGMWYLVDVNICIVKRSHALIQEYSDKLVYSEKLQFVNFIACFNFYMDLFIKATFLGNTWFSDIYYKLCVKKPGIYYNFF